MPNLTIIVIRYDGRAHTKLRKALLLQRDKSAYPKDTYVTSELCSSLQKLGQTRNTHIGTSLAEKFGTSVSRFKKYYIYIVKNYSVKSNMLFHKCFFYKK